MTTLYGIPNCDTMKKARVWLSNNNIDYDFHDYKKQGLDEATLRGWIKQVDWELLLNKRGLMWRKVPQEIKDSIDEASAIPLMLETPSMIKRPVLDTGTSIHVGFKADDYRKIFG